MQTAGNACLGIERKVVLHRGKIRQTSLAHGQPLPIFFKPASIIPMDIEVDDLQTSNRSGFNVHEK